MYKAERHALITTLLVPAVVIAVGVDASWPVIFFLLLVCPLAVLWLVWVVLRDTQSPPPTLPEGHEWDYLDRPDLKQRDEV